MIRKRTRSNDGRMNREMGTEKKLKRSKESAREKLTRDEVFY